MRLSILKQLIDRVWSGGTSPHDSEIYALIHKELSSGAMDAGLWTKATAVSDGNTDRAKSRYIEMRANINPRRQVERFHPEQSTFLEHHRRAFAKKIA